MNDFARDLRYTMDLHERVAGCLTDMADQLAEMRRLFKEYYRGDGIIRRQNEHCYSFPVLKHDRGCVSHDCWSGSW
ncbi:hypothetical protein V2J09_006166 [Rumex salicifolius]